MEHDLTAKKQELGNVIRKCFKDHNHPATEEEITQLIDHISGLGFMQSPEIIDTFIKAVISKN